MLAGWHSRGAQQATAGGLEFVGSRTFTDSGTTVTFTVPLTSLTGGISSAPRAGDLVVAFIGQASAGSNAVPMPADWTQLARVSADDTYDSDLYVIYKTMGATPDTGFNITGGLDSSQNSLAVAIFVYANAVASIHTTASGIDGVLCDPPSITPTVSGSVVVSGGVGAHRLGGSASYSSSDFSLFLSASGEGITSFGRDATIGVGVFEWTSGAFNPGIFTFSGSSATTDSWAALSLVITPA